MILSCTQKQNEAFAAALARQCGEELFPLREAMEEEKACSLFSASAYVLVADFKTVFSRGFLKNFKKISFGGSRILYCIFLCPAPRGAGNSLRFSQSKWYGQLAEKILCSCGLVLFGYDCLCGAAQEDAVVRVAEYTQNARPFEQNGNFPRRARAAQPAHPAPANG